MALHFVEITKDNWEIACKLRPKRSQYAFLPREVVLHSLARCYVQEDKPDRYIPYLILHQDQPVGTFLFRNYGIGTNLISFFIDRKHQAKGLGRLAIQTYIEWVKENHPNANEIELAVSPGNTAARRLYESFGFEYTGEISKKGNLFMEFHFPE
ncbi:MAG: GNAT family N-acetyltransferase [Anaerolineae bacterium]|jgi:diamine N-acetyltransferase|nr:GNAT family N-acetyltransferase [Anaerolineae bacterium]